MILIVENCSMPGALPSQVRLNHDYQALAVQNIVVIINYTFLGVFLP